MRLSVLATLVGLIVARVAAAQTLSPTSVNGALPSPLASALARDSCRAATPARAFGPDTASVIPHVAYRAAVRAADTKDWVVLCVHDASREALIFPEPIVADARPAMRLDIYWDPNDDDCEGWIAVADSQWVRLAMGKQRGDDRHERLQPDERALSIHEGIIDSMCEGEDVSIRYWTGRRWVSLPAYWDEAGLDASRNRR